VVGPDRAGGAWHGAPDSGWAQLAGRNEIGQGVRLGRYQPGDDRAALGDVDLLTALDPGQYPGGVLVELADRYFTHAVKSSTPLYYLPLLPAAQYA
jgi:hypothetical protein